MAKLMGLGCGDSRFVYQYKDLELQASSNTGNLVFNYALKQLITLSPPRFRWSSPAHIINSHNEPILIPMANNIGPHTDLWETGPQIDGVTTPLIVMGIGGQFSLNTAVADNVSSVPSGTVKWLKRVAQSHEQKNISVRGELTLKVLDSLGLGGSAVVLGCPSHFLCPDNSLGQALRTASLAINSDSLHRGIAITAGNSHYTNLGRLEQYLISLIETYGGRYFVQHPQPLLKLANGWDDRVSDAEFALIQQRFFPSKDKVNIIKWLNTFSSTFISVPQWQFELSRYPLAIGTRIHGIQMALQAGVPGVCLYVDSRSKELCETMRIPAIEAKAFQREPDIEQVINLLAQWDWDAYDAQRLSLAEATLNFVESNQLEPTSALIDFVRPG